MRHMMHQTAAPHRPQTNAFAERGIRTILEGTRASLLQVRLPPRFWNIAGRHHAFATAVVGGPDGEISPWMKLHGSDFDGWAMPFGCLAIQGKLEPRPRAQGKLRHACRVLASKAAFSLRAVRTSYQESEERKDARPPESGGNFQVALSSGGVLRINPISEKKRNLSEVTLASNASP